MKKRTISILLALVMVLSEASMCVFALDTTPQQDALNESELELTGSDEASSDAVENTTEESPQAVSEEELTLEGSSSEAKASVAGFDPTATAEETSATISWDAETVADYSVVVYNGDEEVATASGSDGNVKVTDLKAATNYSFKVVVKNGDESLAEETVDVTTKEAAKPAAPPTGFAAYSAYNCVVLEWNAVPNATGYYVYKDGSKYKTVTASPNQKTVVFYATGIGDDNNHKFYVRSFVSSDNYSEPTRTLTKHRVRQMYIRITMKKKKTLTSHDRYKTKRTFKKGTTVTAFGFGGGKYRFYDGGRLYYVSYLSTKGAKAIYNGRVNDNWSRKEAEYFINTTGVASRTGWLIWVSQYDQHVYVFYGSKYNWRVYDDWEVSTGAAKTPSPTGFNKNIFKKVRNRHGLGPWSRFQSWTSFHGKKSSWKLGSPQSHACIRCPSNKAMWIYKSIPLKTSVNVY